MKPGKYIKNADRSEKETETTTPTWELGWLATQLSLMARACLNNGLRLVANVEADEAGPFMEYRVGFSGASDHVFRGYLRRDHEDHFQAVMAMIRGRMVSQVFPPAIRKCVPMMAVTEDDPEMVVISYWKRRLIIEEDVTSGTPNPKNNSSMSCWCGYTMQGVECIRVPDGTDNPKYADVVEVRYVNMGDARGMVVIPIFADMIKSAVSELTLDSLVAAGGAMPSSMVSASVVMEDSQARARQNLDIYQAKQSVDEAIGKTQAAETTGDTRTELQNAISATQGSVPGALYMLAVRDGDCGSEETVKFEIKDEDCLKSVIGKNYLEDGRLHRVNKFAKDLIGKTIEMRSVMHCKLPEPNMVCNACLGDESHLPDAAALFKRLPKRETRTHSFSESIDLRPQTYEEKGTEQ